MSTTDEALLLAQSKAAALFAECVESGMIKAGMRESELSEDVHDLARRRFGLRRHWHRRVVRSGPNTVLTYSDDAVDRQLEWGDLVFLDFGPVFDDWEADYARTYLLGSDPDKLRLIRDIEAAFAAGKRHYQETPNITAGELYDYVHSLAHACGWEFGAPTAGHLVGQFPHETAPGGSKRFSIRHGNPQPIREPDASGATRHWILEIHFVDRQRGFGGFVEELLTL